MSNSPKNALAAAEAICQEKGSRLTEQRREVLVMIWQSPCPIKAYELLEKITKTKGKLQPPTVYRALDFLLDHRLIHRIDSLNAFTACHHPVARHDCFFLICKTCGTAKECCSTKLKAAISRVAKDHLFKPERITLEVSGVCESCRG